MIAHTTTDLVAALSKLLRNQALTLSTAESCTGGGLGYVLTSIPGSSAWYERGFITYSNQAKMDLLGVEANTLAQYGAVSEQTAAEMVNGALKASNTDLSIAITGVAGPEGSEHKPPGTIWIAWASRKHFPLLVKQFSLVGDRSSIRLETITLALQQLLTLLND